MLLCSDERLILSEILTHFVLLQARRAAREEREAVERAALFQKPGDKTEGGSS